jgi:hypothetical protein
MLGDGILVGRGFEVLSVDQIDVARQLVLTLSYSNLCRVDFLRSRGWYLILFCNWAALIQEQWEPDWRLW